MLDDSPRFPDPLIAAFAAQHHGVISRNAALEAGLSDRQIGYRLATERWRRLDRGVYAVNGSPTSHQQSLIAACLAAGLNAAASHLSAAAIERLSSHPEVPWVTVPSATHHRSGQLHRSPLDAKDVTRIDGIPVTAVPRTIIDCAMVCRDRQLSGILDDALSQKLCTPRQIRAALLRVEARPGRRGSGRVRRLLDAWDGSITPESPAEARLVRRIREWGLPDPVLQHVVVDGAGRFVARVDLAWTAAKFAIEYDGLRFHGPNAWAGDESRHAALRDLGWEVRHVERSDLVHGADGLHRFLVRRLG